MLLPPGATVAVADGKKLVLLHNSGHETPKLAALPDPGVASENKGSGGRHHSSAANPDDSQIEEDSFSAGIADILNRQALDGSISDIVIIAAPRTLGELRKHYHKALIAKLLAEIPKDLTGHSMHDIEKAIVAA